MKKLLLTFLLLFSFTISFSQETGDGKKYDVRMLKHYSIEELDDMQINNNEDFVKIQYYFSQSYYFLNFPYAGCINFDVINFDISAYENMRSWNKQVTIDLTEKYCIKLVLLSSSELEHPLPIHDSQILYQQNN